MSRGVVKWFNNSKGYGFLTEDNGRDDIFAHFSCVEMEGYKSLKRGQHVAFEVIDGPKGLQAQNIRLDDSGDPWGRSTLQAWPWSARPAAAPT